MQLTLDIWCVLTCISLHVLHPLRDVAEGVCLGDVVGNDDSVGSSVIALCDGAKPLLSCRVPDLQL